MYQYKLWIVRFGLVLNRNSCNVKERELIETIFYLGERAESFDETIENVYPVYLGLGRTD